MNTKFWAEFGIFLAASLLGGVAVLPYSLRLIPKDKVKLTVAQLFAVSLLQTAVLSALAIGVGLHAAHAIGLGAPYVEAVLEGRGWPAGTAHMVEVAGGLGVLAGFVLLGGDLFFVPHWPEPLRAMVLKTTQWENFAASFYGGINEEFLMRLFGMSGILWLLGRFWHTAAGRPTTGGFWVANLIMTVVFGIGHLPALKGLVGDISRTMLVRTLLLNAPVALLCGWLFWTYGIEAAILAHFSADIIYHVLGTVVLRRRLGAKS